MRFHAVRGGCSVFSGFWITAHGLCHSAHTHTHRHTHTHTHTHTLTHTHTYTHMHTLGVYENIDTLDCRYIMFFETVSILRNTILILNSSNNAFAQIAQNVEL